MTRALRDLNPGRFRVCAKDTTFFLILKRKNRTHKQKTGSLTAHSIALKRKEPYVNIKLA